ncbi:MAG: hypothetical protein U0132_03000 [Gemmatimonadaceae bacterium]
MIGSRAAAQDVPSSNRSWEIRVPSGALLGTGVQRDHIKDARLTAVQFSYLVRPRLALTGTFGWARSRDLAGDGTEKVDVFTSDLGIEARSRRWFEGGPVAVSAFLGGGAGARSYNYSSLDVAAKNNVAGYAALGGEVGMGRVGLRLEARNYLTGFKPLMGAGRADRRNDVVVMGALSFNRRTSGAR